MRCLSVILLGVAAVLACWLSYHSAVDAIEGFGIQRRWKPLDRPYSAYVTGFADRGGVRAKVTALVVEIRFADGTKKQFTSSRSGTLHLVDVGSAVRVLANTVQLFGRPFEAYEIDSAFELWIKDALWAFGVAGFVIGIPLWVFRPLRFKR